jgi:hypothetical protein
LLGKDRKKDNETTAIAGQQIRKYATVLKQLLGRGPRETMEVLLEAVFSVWSALRLYHSTDQDEIVLIGAVSGVE